MPYEHDSLFTLTPVQIAGVLALSLLLWAALLGAMWRLGSRRPAANLLLALGLFWVFVWLSPQAYYAYYRLIIAGLPAQWVVDWPPTGPGEALALMTFTARPSLSAHGQGLLGWSLLALALIRSRRRAG